MKMDMIKVGGNIYENNMYNKISILCFITSIHAINID